MMEMNAYLQIYINNAPLSIAADDFFLQLFRKAAGHPEKTSRPRFGFAKPWPGRGF
jgi:hypothetical protein